MIYIQKSVPVTKITIVIPKNLIASHIAIFLQTCRGKIRMSHLERKMKWTALVHVHCPFQEGKDLGDRHSGNQLNRNELNTILSHHWTMRQAQK